MKDRDFVAISLLPKHGETGVQTHFNNCLKVAKESGLFKNVSFISPYVDKELISRLILGIARRIPLNREIKTLQIRYVLYHLIKRNLISYLSTNNDKNIVIYAQDPLSAKVGIELRRKGFPCEIILVVHYNISEAWEFEIKGIAKKNGWLSNNLQKIEKEVLPKVDKIVFVSKFMKDLVHDRVAMATKVKSQVIPNFIDESIENNKSAISGDLITIGTLEPRKNQVFIISILNELHQLGYKYTLTIIGDGPDRKRLESEVEKYGLEGFVTFTGYLPKASSVISNHRAYIHTSIFESMGIVLIEALSKGKPVFAIPSGGIREVFSDGNEGCYLDPNNTHKNARVIIDIMENAQRYNQMCKEAKKRSIQYSNKYLSRKWLDFIS